MANFHYNPPDDDLNVTHVIVDDFFDVALIRRETGLQIHVLDDGDTCLGGFWIPTPCMEE